MLIFPQYIYQVNWYNKYYVQEVLFCIQGENVLQTLNVGCMYRR